MKAKSVKRIGLGIAAVTVALFWASAASANPQGYWVTPYSEVVRNSYGECWQTGFRTPEMAIPECGGRVAAAAAPAPVVARARLHSRVLFAFDRAVVRPEDAQRLKDEVVAPMAAAAEVKGVHVVGHTDRIGSDAYNQALSERRAAAVASYLTSQGVQSRLVSVEGRGESEPVVLCNDVRGRENRGNRALVECLQPNRRAEVEVDVVRPAE